MAKPTVTTGVAMYQQATEPYANGNYPSSAAPSGGGGDQSWTTAPKTGYGGIVTLERAVTRKGSTGGNISIWVGRWLGNSGAITVTWGVQDGSRTAVSSITGYNALSKTVTFADGEYGWKEVVLPLETWAQTDADHLLFEVTNVSINNAEPFYAATTNRCLVRIVDDSVINTARLFVDKDHVSASDSNAGTQAAPFLTLNKLATEMTTQNKSGYVVAAATAYEELGRVSGSDWSGWSFNRSTGGADFTDMLMVTGLNSAGNRISTAFTGAPVVNNNYQQGNIVVNDAAALYLHAANSMIFEDLELENCQQGFLFHPQGGPFLRIYAERIESHGHVGGDNRASFRWDNSKHCVIHNCRGYRNYDNRSGNVANPYNDANLTAGTFNGQAIYSAHNGVQAFGANNVIVEYSDLSWLGRPVYGKEQRNVDGTLEQSIWVRNNKISWAGNVAYESANQGARPGAKNVGYMFNGVYKATGHVFMKDGGSSGDQADGAFIFNNSGDEIDFLYHASGVTGVRAEDNIAYTANASFAGTPKVIDLMIPENGAFSTFVDSSKANTLHPTAQNFFIDENGLNEVELNSLAAWQTSYTDFPTPATSYMSEDPDEESSTTNPNMAGPANGNYTRSGTPTDSYYGGSQRGAMTNPITVIGTY